MIYGKDTIYLKTLMDDKNVRPLLDKALSTYPMYEPKNPANYSIIPTRQQLNMKLLNHYKYRQIGSETIGRFLDDLETTMCEIMPYYNQLFKSEDIMNGIEDPFGNVDIEERFEQETKGNSSGSSEGTTNNKEQSTNKADSKTNTTAESKTNTDMSTYNKNVNSKTPQSQLEITSQNMDSLGYADNVTWNKDESESAGETTDKGSANTNTTNEGLTTTESSSKGQSSNETSGTTKHVFTKKGNQGVNTYAHDMKELREIFRNIEEEIIHNPKIAELFFLLFE